MSRFRQQLEWVVLCNGVAGLKAGLKVVTSRAVGQVPGIAEVAAVHDEIETRLVPAFVGDRKGLALRPVRLLWCPVAAPVRTEARDPCGSRSASNALRTVCSSRHLLIVPRGPAQPEPVEAFKLPLLPLCRRAMDPTEGEVWSRTRASRRRQARAVRDRYVSQCGSRLRQIRGARRYCRGPGHR